MIERKFVIELDTGSVALIKTSLPEDWKKSVYLKDLLKFIQDWCDETISE